MQGATTGPYWKQEEATGKAGGFQGEPREPDALGSGKQALQRAEEETSDTRSAQTPKLG